MSTSTGETPQSTSSTSAELLLKEAQRHLWARSARWVAEASGLAEVPALCGTYWHPLTKTYREISDREALSPENCVECRLAVAALLL